MKKNDETIQNLFDAYAEELKPRQDLAEKAKMEMVERKSQPSTSARKNSSFWLHFAWITPVTAVFIAIVIVIFNLPVFLGSLGDKFGKDETPSQQQPAPSVAYYTYADVKGRSVSWEDYDDMLQISKLAENGYQVVGEHCFAFYTTEGELRYIKLYLGVRASDGTFTELELIAEVDGYVREDLYNIYDSYKNRDGLSTNSHYASNGEYVTQGYFAARNLHFYVVARNGQRTEVAKDILQVIYQKAY